MSKSKKPHLTLAEINVKHDNLREEVIRLHQQLAILEKEIHEASRLIHLDALTSALNRRGLDDAFDREIANVNRSKTPLSRRQSINPSCQSD
jgi:GGDEF domain-containing protein